MSQNEEKLFMLMAHAEDLQKLAQASLQKVGQAVSHLENASVKAISGAVTTEIDRTLENTKKELAIFGKLFFCPWICEENAVRQ